MFIFVQLLPLINGVTNRHLIWQYFPKVPYIVQSPFTQPTITLAALFIVTTIWPHTKNNTEQYNRTRAHNN